MIVKTPHRSHQPDALPLLNIAVVGHTNTGKTSLIRTMLRSTEFGVIEDAAGTTRHVEQATIAADNEPVLNLYDTPGLEDSRALFAHIKKLQTKLKPLTPAQILEHFITHVPSMTHWSRKPKSFDKYCVATFFYTSLMCESLFWKNTGSNWIS